MSSTGDSEPGAILCVDFGLKRVGLAVTDPRRRTAVGAGCIEGLSGRSLARAVRAEAAKRGVKVILIGQPPQGARGVEPVIRGADALAEASRRFGLEVIRWDESYSTSEALAARRTYGGKSRAGRGWIDEAAAVLILRSYLDAQLRQ